MNRLESILEHNRRFVEDREYEAYMTDRFPDKKMVVVTCMDTRLTELLPRAMNLRNGDAKIIKNAGGIVTQPFGNIMRSILIALYELRATEVFIVGHHECGMTGLDPEVVLAHMRERGIPDSTIEMLTNAGFQLDRWLTGFDNVRESVEKSVRIVSRHPLLPPGTAVHGLIVHPVTGKLDLVVDGYTGRAV